jgi:hypothetical protein
LGREESLSDGLKTRHYKETPRTSQNRGQMLWGGQTWCEDAQESAVRNGFVSGMNLLAAFHDRLAAMIYFCGLSAGRHP